jgi:hypothetical protein
VNVVCLEAIQPRERPHLRRAVGMIDVPITAQAIEQRAPENQIS